MNDKLPLCKIYFEHFLPEALRHSNLSAITALTVSVRFEIFGNDCYSCFCCFEKGRLIRMVSDSDMKADCTYRIREGVFLDMATGRQSLQSAFLSNQVQIDGDTEKAIKLAMILQEFIRHAPCSEELLRAPVS